MKQYKIRKSEGWVYDNINDQLYIHTNYPDPGNEMELNIKAFNNFDDNFSNIIGLENYNYSDIVLAKKRLVPAKPSISSYTGNIYAGNYALASASIVNAYDETFPFMSGWNWTSFPRLER